MASNEQEGHIAGTGTPAGGGHGETSFPPFDPVNFTPMLIWLSLSFGLLYLLLMSIIALPRMESILHTRAHKITALFSAQGLIILTSPIKFPLMSLCQTWQAARQEFRQLFLDWTLVANDVN